MSIGKLLTNRNFYSVLLAVVISFAFVAIMVNGATTISSNISTGGTLTVTGASTLTGITTHSQQAVLFNSTSDPSSPAEGGLYYDSTNRVVKLYNGSDWLTVASSTDADGGLILSDAVGIRFTAIATNYMALGTTTLPVAATPFSGNALLLLNSTTSASVPLAIIGAKGGQTGDLFLVFDDTAEVFSLDGFGNASTSVISTGVNDALFVGGWATTTGENGNFATEGTLTVTGTAAITGNTTLTGSLTANGAVTLGDTAGDAIIITGNASTTNSLAVGTALTSGPVFSISGLSTTTINLADEMATTTIGALGSTLGIGTTTPTLGSKLSVVGDILAASTGTTSLKLLTNDITAPFSGTCIQMVASDGVTFRLYATTSLAVTDNAPLSGLVIEPGSCN